jgi:cytochrome c556
MHKFTVRIAVIVSAILASTIAVGGDDPAHERHELMEGVRDAAKPVGAMFEGELDYDADQVMKSLEVWAAAGAKLGDLFPEGSEGGEAAPAVWEDRAGFDAALAEWRDAIAAAQDAAPATLEEAKPTVGPVFNACKNCHDTYRIEEEE